MPLEDASEPDGEWCRFGGADDLDADESIDEEDWGLAASLFACLWWISCAMERSDDLSLVDGSFSNSVHLSLKASVARHFSGEKSAPVFFLKVAKASGVP